MAECSRLTTPRCALPHPALLQFIQTVLPKMGISATVIDPADLGALERALEEHDVRDGWGEGSSRRAGSVRSRASAVAAAGRGLLLCCCPAAAEPLLRLHCNCCPARFLFAH